MAGEHKLLISLAASLLFAGGWTVAEASHGADDAAEAAAAAEDTANDVSADNVDDSIDSASDGASGGDDGVDIDDVDGITSTAADESGADGLPDDHGGGGDTSGSGGGDDDHSESGGGNDDHSGNGGGDDDHSGSGGGDDDNSDSGGGDDNHSGSGGGDDDNSDSGGGDDDHSGSGGGDDDNSGSGGGDDDHSGSGGGDDENSGSGGGDDDSSGSGGGDDDSSGSGGGNDDSSGSNASGDDNGDHSGSNSGSGSGHDQGSSSDSSEESHHAGQPLYPIEHDERGHEIVTSEVLLTGAAADLEAARSLGFTVLSIYPLESTGGEIVRLRTPDGVSVDQAIHMLHDAAPNALATPNNVYRQSQSSIAAAHGVPHRSSPRRLRGTVGVIDTGVDSNALPNAEALSSHVTFVGRQPVAREHGSIVASIAINNGARVHVADVFGTSADGVLAASAERIAAALDWMIANDIAVINISVEGPHNAVLQDLVRRAAQRGHVIVAAAGNGGPGARPVFPAAYEGSLAVTAIDTEGHPYMRANRGAYIAFAAPGVDVPITSGDREVVVSGTSFAAPVVAAQIAARLQAPSPEGAQRAIAALRSQAEDLGAPGRDPIFGWGAISD